MGLSEKEGEVGLKGNRETECVHMPASVWKATLAEVGELNPAP